MARADRFADLVADAVDRLEPRWRGRLAAVELEVVDAPPAPPGSDEVVLAEHRPGARPRTVVLVVYRKPVELRAPEHRARVDLVRDLVAEELADALGVAPEELDPAYDADADDD